ncbi:MAG TPA: MYXO-CTERM sorting domain-containing protein, partial [Polyangiaceae bacterium]|nr:MYXO-CTERM sorting domain-containing protein [Polyangiaceae bacterium]
ERPFLAPAADGWALVFTDYDVLRAATVSAAGVVEVSAGELGPAAGSTEIYLTALEAVADGYVLLGNGYNEGGWRGRHLDQTLAPTADWVSLSDEGSSAAAAWGAGALLAAFASAADDNAPQIQRLDGNVAVLDDEPTTLSFKPIEQKAPLVARGADAWLVLWHETDFKTSSIRWQLLDDAGAPLSPEPTDLFVGAPGYAQTLALAGSGCGWLVVWEDDAGRLLATRLDSSGAVLDDEPLELDESGGGNGVDATFDGTHWVIAWVGQDNYNQGEATILRVSTEGEFVDGGPIVVSGDSVVGFAGVQVEADDEGYAVSWQADNGGVFLSRVDRSGTPLAGAPQALLAAGAPVGTQKVDYLGGNGWLVWERNEIEHNLNFLQLASGQSSQILGNLGYQGWDVIAMRERALVTMVGDDPSLLSFWLGGSTDPAVLVLELILSGALISSPRLAVQSGLEGLVAFESYERTGVVASTRIKTATLTRSPDGAVDPDDTVDLALGCSPTSEGGSEGDGNGGDSNGNAGEQGTGNANGAGETGAGGEAEGGLGGADGAAPGSSRDKDRYSSCGCRTVGQSSHSPWLLLAFVAAALARRRGRAITASPR